MSSRPVIIYRLGSLGDTVVALPCLHKIAEAFPGAERIALTNSPVHASAPALEAVVAGSGLVHRSIAYPVGTRSPKALMTLASQLRGLRAETLVYLTPSRGLTAVSRDLAFFRLCGVRRIVGAPVTADLQQNRVDAHGDVERECERLARCLAPLGAIDLTSSASWDLRLTAAEHDAARTLIAPIQGRPYLAVNMGGKLPRNDWGVGNWRALLARLGRSCADHGLVFFGAAEDSARASEVGAVWPGPVIDACGRLSPRASAAALARARLFVGHDSGPLHLAAAAGTACVGIFGDNNPPRKWHPCGPRHHIIHCMRGVSAISVAEVAAAVEQRLAAHAATPASDACA